MNDLTSRLFKIIKSNLDLESKKIAVTALLKASRYLNINDLADLRIDFTETTVSTVPYNPTNMTKDEKGAASFTLLQTAVILDEKDIVEILLKGCANPNYTGSIKCSPLWLAVRAQNEAVIQLLLENGANVNDGITWQNKEICTPLMCSVYNKMTKITKLLILYHADPHILSRESENRYDLKLIDFVKDKSNKVDKKMCDLITTASSLFKAIVFSDRMEKELASAKILQAFTLDPELTLEYLEKVALAIGKGETTVTYPSNGAELKNRFYNPLLLRLFIFEMKKCVEENNEFLKGNLFQMFYNNIFIHLLAYEVKENNSKVFMDKTEKDSLIETFSKGQSVGNTYKLMDGTKHSQILEKSLEENKEKLPAMIIASTNVSLDSPVFTQQSQNSQVKENKEEILEGVPQINN